MGTPAIEDPWYLLATLAGTESLNHAENQRLWNGYQRVLLGDQFPPRRSGYGETAYPKRG